MLALSGFEAPAPLAQEARRPGKFIGQAIMLYLGSIGIFVIFYASAVGCRAGTLAASFGRIHPSHQTPTFAIAFFQVSGIAAILLVGFL